MKSSSLRPSNPAQFAIVAECPGCTRSMIPFFTEEKLKRDYTCECKMKWTIELVNTTIVRNNKDLREGEYGQNIISECIIKEYLSPKVNPQAANKLIK